MNQNNYSKDELLEGYSDRLFGVHYHDIHRILLPDNEYLTGLQFILQDAANNWDNSHGKVHIYYR